MPEISALGIKFALTRWLVNISGILAIAYIIDRFLFAFPALFLDKIAYYYFPIDPGKNNISGIKITEQGSSPDSVIFIPPAAAFV